LGGTCRPLSADPAARPACRIGCRARGVSGRPTADDVEARRSRIHVEPCHAQAWSWYQMWRPGLHSDIGRWRSRGPGHAVVVVGFACEKVVPGATVCVPAGRFVPRLGRYQARRSVTVVAHSHRAVHVVTIAQVLCTAGVVEKAGRRSGPGTHPCPESARIGPVQGLIHRQECGRKFHRHS